jgi:SAM-dependent methyltransferase
MVDEASIIGTGLRPFPSFAGVVDRVRRAGRTRSAIRAVPIDDHAHLSLDRTEVRQRLYGRGYLIPGDAAHVLNLVEPFQLDGAASLLDLAAGLGGPARAIAQAFHARVLGLERDPDLARRNAVMSAALGTSSLVRVRGCDPETVELDTGRYDCALGREATYMVAEKERLLRVVVQALKSRGQIILTDFVLDRSAGERDELACWSDSRERRPSLWTLAQYTDCFRSLGFNLRSVTDIGPFHRRQILAAWIALLRSGDIRRLSPSQVDTVLAEAESSLRTVAALESGALKYYRFEAIAHYSFW